MLSVVLVFFTVKVSVSVLLAGLVVPGPAEKVKTSDAAAKAGAAAAVEITGTDHAAVRTSVRRLGPRAPVVADSDALVSLFTVLPPERWCHGAYLLSIRSIHARVARSR